MSDLVGSGSRDRVPACNPRPNDTQFHEMEFRAPTPQRPTRPPSFSVVIPAYQSKATIGDAVASALAQTCPPHEVIVVDDGSTDDLAGELSPYLDRISVIRKENGGAASARNLGVAAASGDFLAILDADDVWHPRRLEALEELAAARADLDIISSDTWFVLDGQRVGRFYAANPFSVTDQRIAILRNCFVGCCPAVRLARFRAIGGFDERLRAAEDWDCWIRLILDGATAGLVDEPLLEYRLHPGSLTSDRVRSLWARVQVLEKTATNPSLQPAERSELALSLLRHRTRAITAEAEAELTRPRTRRLRLLHLAILRGVPTRIRLLVAAAAVVPRLGRRWFPRDTGASGRDSR